MKFKITTLLSFFCVFSIFAQTPVEIFIRKGFNHSERFVLYNNGNYFRINESVSCVVREDGKRNRSVHKKHGKYSVKNGFYYFSPYKSSLESKEQNFFFQVLEYEGAKFLLYTSNQSVLSGTNQFIEIANHLNNSDSTINIGFGYFMLQKKGMNSIKAGKDIKESFPIEFQNYILDQPISADVIAVEEVASERNNGYYQKYKVTLDIGKKEGIKPYMNIYDSNPNNSNSCVTLNISDVFESECVAYVVVEKNKCKIGKTYCTKYFKTKKS